MIQTKTERFEMRLEPEILERIDDWRKDQGGFPSRAEAIRQLVETGLSLKRSPQPKLSDSDKLILMMLSEITKTLPGEREIDPSFLEEVLHGGHYWALSWKYPGLFHNEVDNPKTVDETLDIIEMWDWLELSFRNLSQPEKEFVKRDAKLDGDVSFPGFDGNNEAEYRGILKILTGPLERFSDFATRARLNSHAPMVDSYRRMLAVFKPMQKDLRGGGLNAVQIIEIMTAQPHPESPRATEIGSRRRLKYYRSS